MCVCTDCEVRGGTTAEITRARKPPHRALFANERLMSARWRWWETKNTSRITWKPVHVRGGRERTNNGTGEEQGRKDERKMTDNYTTRYGDRWVVYRNLVKVWSPLRLRLRESAWRLGVTGGRHRWQPGIRSRSTASKEEANRCVVTACCQWTDWQTSLRVLNYSGGFSDRGVIDAFKWSPEEGTYLAPDKEKFWIVGTKRYVRVNL